MLDKTPVNDVLEILRSVEDNNSQSSLAKDTGFSVGKVNYVLKELANKGFIKIDNFVNSKNKKAYKYLLTQKGLQEKIRLTKSFIEIKKNEYEKLQQELVDDESKAVLNKKQSYKE